MQPWSASLSPENHSINNKWLRRHAHEISLLEWLWDASVCVCGVRLLLFTWWSTHVSNVCFASHCTKCICRLSSSSSSTARMRDTPNRTHESHAWITKKKFYWTDFDFNNKIFTRVRAIRKMKIRTKKENRKTVPSQMCAVWRVCVRTS